MYVCSVYVACHKSSIVFIIIVKVDRQFNTPILLYSNTPAILLLLRRLRMTTATPTPPTTPTTPMPTPPTSAPLLGIYYRDWSTPR
jgi:hypothetical protein